jgi:MFS family permease
MAPEPLIPADVLANPVVAKGTIAACFGMGVLIGLTIYTPIYLETVHKLTASQSGLALIPLVAGTVVGATLSGRIMARVRHYKRVPVIGLTVAIAALGALAFEPRGWSLLVLEALLAMTSVGLGTLLPVTTVAIQNAFMPHQLGTATGAMNFFRSLGGALIVAAFGAILFGRLPEAVLTRTTIDALATGIAESGIDVASVFRWVFAAAAFGLVLALGSIASMEERPLKSRVS